MELGLNDAFMMALERLKKAGSIHVDVCISIVNSHGEQIFFCKMDNALKISEKLAFKKAYSSISLRVPTAEIKKLVDDSLCGLDSAMAGEIVMFGGGIPIFKDGELLGAIGVSGGAVEEDILIAKSALEVFNK